MIEEAQEESHVIEYGLTSPKVRHCCCCRRRGSENKQTNLRPVHSGSKMIRRRRRVFRSCRTKLDNNSSSQEDVLGFRLPAHRLALQQQTNRIITKTRPERRRRSHFIPTRCAYSAYTLRQIRVACSTT